MKLKYFFALLIGLFTLSPVYAISKDSLNAVTMVSYEQSWLDSNGTLALKNNTQSEIRNVTFQITYLDMSGNPLDYEEFVRNVTIAPGMTKKVDIPAYEHDRHYHYYKSENMPSGSPAFKVKFDLKDYNSGLSEVRSEDNDLMSGLDSYIDDYEVDKENTGIALGAAAIGLFICLIIVGIMVGLYVLVAVMAKKRNRNVALWVLLSILASPLIIIIILLVVGEDNGDINEIR